MYSLTWNQPGTIPWCSCTCTHTQWRRRSPFGGTFGGGGVLHRSKSRPRTPITCRARSSAPRAETGAQRASSWSTRGIGSHVLLSWRNWPGFTACELTPNMSRTSEVVPLSGCCAHSSRRLLVCHVCKKRNGIFKLALASRLTTSLYLLQNVHQFFNFYHINYTVPTQTLLPPLCNVHETQLLSTTPPSLPAHYTFICGIRWTHTHLFETFFSSIARNYVTFFFCNINFSTSIIEIILSLHKLYSLPVQCPQFFGIGDRDRIARKLMITITQKWSAILSQSLKLSLKILLSLKIITTCIVLHLPIFKQDWSLMESTRKSARKPARQHVGPPQPSFWHHELKTSFEPFYYYHLDGMEREDKQPKGIYN